MSRYFSILLTLLMGASLTAAANIDIPKQVIIDLIDIRCDNPDPNPGTSSTLKPVLDYDCSEKYEDSDGDEQSMDYGIRLIPLIAQDFDKDGVTDLAVEVESSGPLGGSITTNSAVHYLMLDNDKKILSKYEVLLYAPFSEHIVEYKVEGTRIYYSSIPNYRSNPEAYENGSPINPPLEFEIDWSMGIPMNTYYKDNCVLDNNSNNKIFIPEKGVKRSRQIDIHEYIQAIEEEMAIDNLKVAAELNGCNGRNVSFSIRPQDGKPLPVLADVLQALIPVTYQDKLLRELLVLDKKSQISFGTLISLSDGWTGQIYIDRSVDNASISINLSESE